MKIIPRWIRRALPLLPLFLAAAPGCAAMTPAQFWPNENSSLLHAPRDPSQILVVREGAPSAPYAIVGTMDLSLNSATAGTLFTNLSWFTERFRERAAQAGADGIMNMKVARIGTSGTETTDGRVATVGTSSEIYEMTADAFVLMR